MATKKPAKSRQFYCSKCAKKRKFTYIWMSWGDHVYSCPHCGTKQRVM